MKITLGLVEAGDCAKLKNGVTAKILKTSNNGAVYCETPKGKAFWVSKTDDAIERYERSNDAGTRYEAILRRISKYVLDREYEKAAHHIKRIWGRREDMTDLEEEVLRALALNPKIKF